VPVPVGWRFESVPPENDCLIEVEIDFFSGD
jgi:hypothetical protein